MGQPWAAGAGGTALHAKAPLLLPRLPPPLAAAATSCPAAGGCWPPRRGCPTPAALWSSRPWQAGCGQAVWLVESPCSQWPSSPCQAAPHSQRQAHLWTMHSMTHRRSAASPCADCSAAASSSSVRTWAGGSRIRRQRVCHRRSTWQRGGSPVLRVTHRRRRPPPSSCPAHPRCKQLALAVVHRLRQPHIVPVFDGVVGPAGGAAGHGRVRAQPADASWGGAAPARALLALPPLPSPPPRPPSPPPSPIVDLHLYGVPAQGDADPKGSSVAAAASCTPQGAQHAACSVPAWRS